jgi:Fe-S oxidoreductase
MPETQPRLLDDDLWERLVDLTDGAVTLCYQCGECTAACPWGMLKGAGRSSDLLPVRQFMHQAQLGLDENSRDLWLCTTCGQCEAYCPRGVNITEVFRGLRLLAWERRKVEEGLPTLLWSIYWNGNPWSQPPSQRAAWAGKLDLPKFDPLQHEVLLYVGCTASYDRRSQKIARDLVTTLRAAGVSFGYLGEEEPCCGESALSLGHRPYFEEIALHAAQVFRQKGVKTLMTVSPHCYDVFKNQYPRLEGANGGGAGLTAWHYTQYLAQLLDDGRLKFNSDAKRQGVRVTYQDACYLGRHNGEYAAPRRLLEAIPGVELVEMRRSGVDGLCCGGGGGQMWAVESTAPVESTTAEESGTAGTVPGERFADLRIQEAMQTGAGILATACPFCLACLEERRFQKSSSGEVTAPVRVMDISELTAWALAGR